MPQSVIFYKPSGGRGWGGVPGHVTVRAQCLCGWEFSCRHWVNDEWTMRNALHSPLVCACVWTHTVLKCDGSIIISQSRAELCHLWPLTRFLLNTQKLNMFCLFLRKTWENILRRWIWSLDLIQKQADSPPLVFSGLGFIVSVNVNSVCYWMVIDVTSVCNHSVINPIPQ